MHVFHVPSWITLSALFLTSILASCRMTELPLPAAELGFDLHQPVPYTVDAATAVLLHLDGDISDAAGRMATHRHEGGEWTADGIMGRAWLCDGNQRVVLPPVPALAGGFTVEAWVRLKAAADFTTYHLASWKGVFETGFEMRPGLCPRPRMLVQTDAGTHEMRTMNNFSCNRWVHVAWVYEPGPTIEHHLTMYIHGQPVGLRNGTAHQVKGRVMANDEPLVLFEGLVGTVDEVRISHRARSPQELRAPWPSGRSGDFEPFAPDVVAARPPADWDANALWLAAAQAVPTYHAISLYVPYQHDADENGRCQVRFRQQGARRWRAGLDLLPDRRDREFRGSLLNLEPDRLYHIELLAEDAKPASGTAPALRLAVKTWPEQVPIAEVRPLPPGKHQEQLVIQAEGRPDAWILYAPPAGESVEYDAGKDHAAAVVIHDSAYVILRNITARGGTMHGIQIVDSHDVRVQRCEITGWGEPTARHPVSGLYVIEGTSATINGRDGIRIGRSSVRVTVEDNFIHTPLGSANSWRFGHPAGPHALLLGYNGAHHNVIRNNEMIGSEERWWNDTIEGAGNQAVHGGPYRDTDMYGNVLAFANDNAVELDGGQINVRFWDNRMVFCYRSISFSPCRKGPGYAFRNLVTHQDSEHDMAGTAYKVGSIYSLAEVGWNLILQNTVFGAGGAGLANGTHEDERRAFRALAINNLYASESEHVNAAVPLAHRLGQGLPVFADSAGGDFRLMAGSLGIDEGAPIPTLNDHHTGKAADLGRFELGAQEDGFFPARASGLRVQPQHAHIEAFEDEEISQAAVAIHAIVPTSAGRRWKAHASSPWIVVTPAAGTALATPQRVEARIRPRGLTPGPWRGAVTFRTDEGYNASMTFTAEVRQRTPFRLLLEAEDAQLEGPFVVGEDPRASGGRYVYAPAETPSNRVRMTFSFEVPEAGDYYVLLRAGAPAPVGAHSSFFVRVNGEELTYSRHTPGHWKLSGIGTDWTWWLRGYDYNERRPLILDRDPRALRLTAGQHTLTLSNRQPECRLDAALISSQPIAAE